MSLSDIVVAYKKVMKEYGVDSQTDNHYYSLMIKLSLNQKGNTWRQCLQLEKVVGLAICLNHVANSHEPEGKCLPKAGGITEVLLSVDSELHHECSSLRNPNNFRY